MKKTLLLLCAGWGLAALAAVDFTGVEKLADRLGGEALTAKVRFEEWPGQNAEKARILPNGETFTIKATGVHIAAQALGVYLRDVAKGHVSWCGKRLPETWAVPTAPIDVMARFPYAMAYNYCTLSYTMAFWGKTAWQEEIDRLALAGYNTALLMAGVQKVWQLTLEEMGYTKRQQQNFIADDAVQAWWLMGNLQACGNNTAEGRYPIVSDEAIETDAELGRWLVKAFREVGIEPVFQGFVGLVPSSTTARDLARKLRYAATDPAKIRIFRNGFYEMKQKSPDLLDPTCAAFKDFSDAWNRNLKSVYGLTDPADFPKYLAGDLFHESAPPKTMTPDQQTACAQTIQAYQQAAFPGVTWVLQSWIGSPRQTLRDGLDPAHTLIQYLDQKMSATDACKMSFRNERLGVGLPWVWVEVLNFGGNTGMHGAFRRFTTLGNIGRGDPLFRGYGLLSEGLETNPVSYDLYNSRFVRRTPETQNLTAAELDKWLEAYHLRRYGYTDDDLKRASALCSATVWTCTTNQQGTVESVFCAQPSFWVTKVSAWGPEGGTPYDRRLVVEAAERFLAVAKRRPDLLALETFRYDFVEIFQQILTDRAREILPSCKISQNRRAEFRRMLDLLDQLLACSDAWRLDCKEARTREKAPEAGVAGYRRMITTWTPGTRGQTVLSQYAHRAYAGLVKHYYAVKWAAFFEVAEGTRTKADYEALCAELERDFPTRELPPTPTDGDPVALAEAILQHLTETEK